LDDASQLPQSLARFKSSIDDSFILRFRRADRTKSRGDESIEQLERRPLTRRPTEHVPPNGSGATSNPELPKLRFLIRALHFRIARISRSEGRRT